VRPPLVVVETENEYGVVLQALAAVDGEQRNRVDGFVGVSRLPPRVGFGHNGTEPHPEGFVAYRKVVRAIDEGRKVTIGEIL
jgi:hypothetical protein